jgi:hypothetical protein
MGEIDMVGFKEWRDYNKFMQTYAICCCQNCTGFNGDLNKGQFVCMQTLSPVRLDMLGVCAEWQNSDGRILDDYDKDMFPFRFSEEVWEKLIHIDGDKTFEWIKEFIDNETIKE